MDVPRIIGTGENKDLLGGKRERETPFPNVHRLRRSCYRFYFIIAKLRCTNSLAKIIRSEISRVPHAMIWVIDSFTIEIFIFTRSHKKNRIKGSRIYKTAGNSDFHNQKQILKLEVQLIAVKADESRN